MSGLNKGFFEPCWIPGMIDRNGDMVEKPDKRDLRDPQKLGEMLLGEADNNLLRLSTFSALADAVGTWPCPNYPQDESMAVVTAREYRAELEARTDKYAKSALARIDKGERVEYDDPAGN